jgi:sugar/nucleoside kinase (ribokinase family)
VVVAKRGALGALVAAGAERLVIPVEPVEAIADTIGAGDSFDAGFVVAWLSGQRLVACAAVGNACGRASIQARGGIQGQPRAAELAGLGVF